MTGKPDSPQLSSPPCYLQEFEPSLQWQPADWEQLKRWRDARRRERIAARLARPVEERQRLAQPILRRLGEVIAELRGPLGVYWPIRGELDLRELMQRHFTAGGVVALPVVVEKKAPVEFWRWQPDMPMQRGVWNIPVPAQRHAIAPELVIVPLVGFDAQRYRLGYGGGFYDRTLAAAKPRPRTIGVGFAEAELPTIHPQPHDIPMDEILVR